MDKKDLPKKKILSARISAEAYDLLNQLCALDERSQAYIIERLIKEAAAKEKIKVKK